MSIAGGYYKAVEQAHRAGCECVQLFTKNNNQWRAKEIVDDDVVRFQEALTRLKIAHPIAHDSYLINLASPDEPLWTKSLDAMVVELLRAERLGILYLVIHPGAYTSSSEQAGLARICQALDEIHKQTAGIKAKILLETTAGQGSNLGWKFEHLATILDGVQHTDRLDVCVDTCHIFAAGYPITSEADYKATFKAFDKLIGVKRVKAFHVNDSKAKFGSRVDRHAHIGRGEIGIDGFRNLVNDSRFRKVPFYLETPKGEEDGQLLDVINLQTLRSLIRPAAASKK